MNQSLIYKYLPKNLDDFITNKNLIEFLNKLIKINKLNFLLIGESGTGKTCIIDNIIRKYYNYENDTVFNNNDILSLNPMNEHCINYFRNEIKIFCQTLSNSNKKKTLILDDLDTINEQNQEIIKNCIDKYSSNINFMCSCKNLQKIITSLQSRLFVLKVEDINNSIISNLLNIICKNEKINITKDAKEIITILSNNSIKCMINYLEKLKLFNKKINYDLAIKLSTSISYDDFEKYTNYCKNNQLNDALKIIFEIKNNYYSIIDILDLYYYYIKNSNNLSDDYKYKIIKIISEYITYYYTIHEDNLEILFFTNKLCLILNDKDELIKKID